MGKINVETIHSPLRNRMPWLIAVAIAGCLIGSVADITASAMEERLWWGFGIISFIGSACAAIIDIALLYAVLRATGQKLLSIPLYIGTTMLFCVSWLLIDVTEPIEMIFTEYDVLGIAIIVAGILSASGYIILEITMWKRLKNRFDGPLSRVGAAGMSIAKYALIAIGALLISYIIGSVALLILVAYAAVAVLSVLTFRYMRTILYATEQSAPHYTDKSIKKLYYITGRVILILILIRVFKIIGIIIILLIILNKKHNRTHISDNNQNL